MFKLVIADEEGTKTTVPLVRDEISIGRKEGNTIRLTERNISRTHAQLKRSNGGFLLRDLGSYNGVLVNGQRVDGEAAVKAGDQIKLGDYLMAVESDQPVAEPAASPAPPAARVSAAPLPPPARVPTEAGAVASARLVMLTGPAPGAEFDLPSKGATRIGRGQELDIPIDHRSVSREHAELRFGADGARVVDLGSANGMRVNGAATSDRPLSGGDVIELGQVALRYVAPGEHYVFDPNDAAPYLKAAGGRANGGLLALGAVALTAVAVLVFFSGDEATTTVTPLPPAPRVSSVAAAPAATPEPAEVVEAAPAPDPFDAALAACRDAVSGERFAEAIAHATSATKARPDDAQAAQCLAVANAGHGEEQAYVRGRSALQSGDPEAAMAEFSRLPPTSVFAAKPEIAAARVALAEARRIAAAAPPVEAVAAIAPVKTRPAARSAQPRTQPSAAARPPAPAPEVELPTGQSPFQVASACLARGDNPCVIRALTGKARTPQELGLLIETHRSLGNTDKATAGMEQYVKQFPTGPKAVTYRRLLDRQGQ